MNFCRHFCIREQLALHILKFLALGFLDKLGDKDAYHDGELLHGT